MSSKLTIFGVRGVTAIMLKFCCSRGENKVVHTQFGASLTVFIRCVKLGMVAVIHNIGHPKMRVIWDRSKENLDKMRELTEDFEDIPGVLVMIDRRKMVSLHPPTSLEQNREYNGWTEDVNRNVDLLWSPYGKIIDAAVNTPGRFHDSKSTLWCNISSHIVSLPDGYDVVCYSAFTVKGEII